MKLICIEGHIEESDNEGKILLQEERVFLNEEYSLDREYMFEGMKLYSLQERSPFRVYDSKTFKIKK